jgi:hypothetical protein
MASRVLLTLLQLILPLIVATPAKAIVHEPQQMPMHRLPLDGALSQNSVTSIIQDRSGLMWFATQDSVNVYDGYTFRVLSADPRNANALSGVLISKLFEDRDGQIWIAGFLGWLDRLDPRTGKIHHFPRELYGPGDGPGSFVNTGERSAVDRHQPRFASLQSSHRQAGPACRCGQRPTATGNPRRRPGRQGQIVVGHHHRPVSFRCGNPRSGIVPHRSERCALIARQSDHPIASGFGRHSLGWHVHRPGKVGRRWARLHSICPRSVRSTFDRRKLDRGHFARS